jgi:hypothetical protein
VGEQFILRKIINSRLKHNEVCYDFSSFEIVEKKANSQRCHGYHNIYNTRCKINTDHQTDGYAYYRNGRRNHLYLPSRSLYYFGSERRILS